MKTITIVTIFLLVFAITMSVAMAAMNSSNYQIWADTFSAGGGEDEASLNYNLVDTIGEAAIGLASSTNYASRAGFRQAMKDPVLTLSIGSASLQLGELKKTATKSTSHTLTVESNAASGVSVTFSGSTLTCNACRGTKTISAIGSVAAAPAIGASQFGLNAVYKSGDATPTAQSPYNGAGSYAFHSGDEIISAAGAMGSSAVFDITFIANISGLEALGTYTTAITYTATANF